MEQPVIETRWKQRLASFSKAYDSLCRGRETLLTDPQNELMQAGMIQMYEFTFELAWKVLKDYLQSEGFTVASPKAAIRQAVQSEYIADGELWLAALECRNLTTHTYDEAFAASTVSDITTLYIPMMGRMRETFRRKAENQ